MAAPLIVVKTFAIKEGKIEDARRLLPELFEVMEASEPRALAIYAYVDEQAVEVSFVQVHPDAASLEHSFRVEHEHAGPAQQVLAPTRASRSTGSPATSSWRR